MEQFEFFHFLNLDDVNSDLLIYDGLGMQATRHARRVYVGGLPPMANEQVSLVKSLDELCSGNI